jgi:hypothetical protein
MPLHGEAFHTEKVTAGRRKTHYEAGKWEIISINSMRFQLK